ncbi:uncharacterized protein DDB_G0284459-like isoform X2 [Mizuhopecten yessoensis]|uniref:uncharacterized protein DDB_G0284459-like isoform X2 n=1 Tax=Mizuhopecten yessoensis TaxID=6573 RepID=UPI000B45E415|nr:uncharacterized protein DDB_G0284459-like isoform X2 [Mizuhopecten yessoensis]
MKSKEKLSVGPILSIYPACRWISLVLRHSEESSAMEKGTAGLGSIPLPTMDTIPLPDGSPTPSAKTKARKPIKLVRYDVNKAESQIPLPTTKKDPPKPAKELIAEKLNKKSNSSNTLKEIDSKCSSNGSNPVSSNHSLSKLKRSLMQKERNVEGPLEQSIVDEMFKDFLATKMQQIESEYQGKAEDRLSRDGQAGEVASSVEEMNRLLDDELTTISQNTSQKDVCLQEQCSQSTARGKHKLVEAKLESKSKRSKWDMKEKQEKDTCKNKSAFSKPQIKAENVVCVKSTKLSKDKISKSSSDQQSWINIESSGVSTNVESLKSSLSSSSMTKVQEILVSATEGTPTLLPVSDTTKTEEESRNVKTNINIALAAQFGKKNPAKKQIPLKISQVSAEFISSGEQTGKEAERRKALEDGEVISSNEDDSEKQESNDEDSEDDEENNAVSETGSLSNSDKDTKSSKSKKKKKKKNKKHKKKKKHKSSKDHEKDDTKRDESKRKHRSPSRSRSPKKHKSSRSPNRRSRKSRSRTPKRWEDHGFDAYAYRETGRNKSKDRDRGRGRSRDRSTERSRDRSRERTRNRSRDRCRERGRPDRRSRSRSLEKSADLRVKIDKAKLREIAIKNVLAMAKSGHGPSVDLTTIKAGGTSVDELTDFCKRISSKEKNRGTETFLSSSEEESDADEKDEDESFIHHPFKVRDPSASIVMNIRNAKPLPVLTPKEKITEQSKLRMQFPVSSGSVHRLKEPEWVPVQKTSTTTTTLALMSSTPATASFSASLSTSLTIAISNPTSTVAKDTPQFVPPPPPTDPPPPPTPEERVFTEPTTVPMDIGTIISERLLAVRKLQENPKDISALSNIANAQKKASMWATSKQLPGQFMGSTGAQILTPEELIGPDKRRQAWAKKILKVIRHLLSVWPPLHTEPPSPWTSLCLIVLQSPSM